MPELEADDAMGIYATANPGNIIVSPDKDMRQIPGKLYDLKETMTIGKLDGHQWHYIQTLSGDQTDGYGGVPGIGVKKASALFEKEGYTWETVVKAFESKGLDENDALMNARLAKILTCKDYDAINNESFPGPPPPVLELTMEQQFKLRRIEDLLPEAEKEDIITVLLALQRQCFTLSNNMTNLIQKWPNPPRITPEDL